MQNGGAIVSTFYGDAWVLKIGYMSHEQESFVSWQRLLSLDIKGINSSHSIFLEILTLTSYLWASMFLFFIWISIFQITCTSPLWLLTFEPPCFDFSMWFQHFKLLLLLHLPFTLSRHNNTLNSLLKWNCGGSLLHYLDIMIL